ncbi:MAG TPA: GGDEF domain-containing protein [Methylibium sp.]|nr:GGDEF domain-containing protein [Methylibium sp.]
MSDFFGSVISLTGCRDRDLLAVTVAWVLADELKPLAVQIHRCVGAPARLLRLAGERRDAPPLAAQPAWTPIEELPAAADWPSHALALERGRPVVVNDASEAAAPATLSVFPLTVGAQRVGLVELRTEQPLDAEQQRFVIGLLTIYRNQLRLLDDSECDTLTGLLNRKTYEAQFGRCLLDDGVGDEAPQGVQERRGDALTHWMGVIDIDHFKRVNDGFGHLIGDEVLLLVAQLLRSTFRHGDRLYRFGGEEFVVLLRAPGREAAGAAFERLRAAMEAYRFPQVGRVTASVGYTELRPFDNAAAAFERADRAVYRAKDCGRNQVQCHEALVEAGLADGEHKVGEIELF